MLGREESCVNEVVCYSFVLLTFWISLKTEDMLIDFVCASSLLPGPVTVAGAQKRGENRES